MKTKAGFTRIAVALQGLRIWSEPAFERCLNGLYALDIPIHAAQILQSLDPAAFSQVCGTYRTQIAGDPVHGEESPHSYLVEKALAAIHAVAPIDLEYIDMLDWENENSFFLYPQTLGFPMNWDTWDELASGVSEYCSEDWTFYVFVTSLSFHDRSVFEQGIEYFGWNTHVPSLDDITGFDWERFARLLTENGMVDFITAWDVCAYNTGNIYFDFNIYDAMDGSVQYDLPSFDLDAVRMLAQEYQNAQSIYAVYQRVIETLESDNALWEKLLTLYESCILRNKKKLARTLAEVFTEQENEGLE